MGVVPVANYRVDAWVTPPPYTAKPPVILPGLRPGEQTQTAHAQPVSVPAGSILVIRSTANTRFELVASGGLDPNIGRVIDFEQIPQGLDDLAQRRVRGKIVARGV